jgi:ribosomal-protein-alanine N-acetyltransferase
MRIETKRLILRTPRKSDWEDIFEGANDIDVGKNLLVLPYPYRKKDAKDFIVSCIKKQSKKKPTDYDLAIELKAEKKVIGITSITPSHEDPKVGVTGSWINRHYWRKGYILEAKVSILDFAFNNLKMRKVETTAFVENVASNNMSRKLGFKLEGTKRKSVTCRSTGIVHDENIYGIFMDEWTARRPMVIKSVSDKIKKYS